MDPTAAGRRRALDQRILQTLMIAFQIIMCDELRHRSSEMSFAPVTISGTTDRSLLSYVW